LAEILHASDYCHFINHNEY